MEGEQDSRKRKLAALKARREQGNLANAALAEKEEARFGGYTFSIFSVCFRRAYDIPDT